MTDKQYLEYRAIMQTANNLKGQITSAKGSVSQYTGLLDVATTPSKIEFAERKLKEWINKLNAYKIAFAALQMPVETTSEAIDRTKFCPACSAVQHGVKTRMRLEHTCELKHSDLDEFDVATTSKDRLKDRRSDSLNPKY